MNSIKVDSRYVGEDSRCFVIAEAGVNHNGDLSRALALVDAAVRAGADAVKFQTFSADRLVTRQAQKAPYQIATTGAAETQYEMLRRLELSAADHGRLADRCREAGVMFLSTPFDEESADFLVRLGVAAIKVPSGEVTNTPFLAHVARMGRPLIVSTGMSSLDDVRQAVDTVRAAGNRELVLLHCVSAYPAHPGDINLRAMHTLSETFDVPVGFSDHTLGIEIAVAAVALGACVIEKHVTLDRTLPGPDHHASLEPAELTTLVAAIRAVEAALGDGRKIPAASEAEVAAAARRSLVAACDIVAGTRLTEAHIVARRPDGGLPPAMLFSLIGRTTRQNVAASTQFTLDMVL